MFVMMRMVANTKIMGKFVVDQRLSILGGWPLASWRWRSVPCSFNLSSPEKGGSMGLSKA